MKKILFLIASALFLSGCQSQTSNNAYNLSNSSINVITPTLTQTMNQQESTSSSTFPTNQRLFATLKTSKGDIKLELYGDKTPNTVANFVGLAQGTKEWTDPATGKKMTNTPFYNGIIFHRVIKDFMIQGGDPLGKGYGGPGYKFDDEPFSGDYIRGTLAMANAGPNTNGSQFFIMHKDMALPKNYVIFGKVVSGIEVVDKIAETPTDPQDKPLENIVINSVEISAE